MGRQIKKPEPRLTRLKVIENSLGAVRHGLRVSDVDFSGFGEVYFSEVSYKNIKGWKQHTRMNLNLMVASGKIRFTVLPFLEDIFTDEVVQPLIDVELSANNHQRLMIPPLYWFAFSGLGEGQNVLINFADIEHCPNEANNLPIDHFQVTGLCL